MAVESATYKIPSPEDGDVPNGPAQFKAQADKVDAIKWLSQNLKPTTGVVVPSEQLITTTSYQDLPGAILEITPVVASIILITATFDCILSYSESLGGFEQRILGTIKVDAAAEETNTAFFEANQSAALTGNRSHRATVSQVYRIALTAAKHTIKMRAKQTVGTVTASVQEEGSRFIYQLVAS